MGPNITEIAPHLKLRDKFGLFAGVRPVKSYPNTPQPLVDSRARLIDFVILEIFSSKKFIKTNFMNATSWGDETEFRANSGARCRASRAARSHPSRPPRLERYPSTHA